MPNPVVQAKVVHDELADFLADRSAVASVTEQH